jgi:sensor histidine kinase regulating citrate/malate metabolism
VANALENALEAIEKVPEEKRYLQFERIYNGRKLKLLTKNPCAVKTTFGKDGLPISTRPIQSGIGTAQIKRIAEKYSGVASFSQQNDVFILKVIMTCM